MSSKPALSYFQRQLRMRTLYKTDKEAIMDMLPVYQGLSDRGKKAMLEYSRLVEGSRSKMIFEAGERSFYVNVLLAGDVILEDPVADGVCQYGTIIYPGEVIGLDAFSPSVVEEGQPRRARALNHVRYIKIDRRAIEILAMEGAFINWVLHCAVETTNRIFWMVNTKARNSVTAALASFLCSYHEVTGMTTVNIRQEDLGRLLGVTRVTVNKALSELRKAGAVTIGQGKTELTDFDLLRETRDTIY